MGDLRLRLPKPIESYNGTIDATQPATQCIQLTPTIRTDAPPELLQDMMAYAGALAASDGIPQSEDCACPALCVALKFSLGCRLILSSEGRPYDQCPGAGGYHAWGEVACYCG